MLAAVKLWYSNHQLLVKLVVAAVVAYSTVVEVEVIVVNFSCINT